MTAQTAPSEQGGSDGLVRCWCGCLCFNHIQLNLSGFLGVPQDGKLGFNARDALAQLAHA